MYIGVCVYLSILHIPKTALHDAAFSFLWYICIYVTSKSKFACKPLTILSKRFIHLLRLLSRILVFFVSLGYIFYFLFYYSLYFKPPVSI